MPFTNGKRKNNDQNTDREKGDICRLKGWNSNTKAWQKKKKKKIQKGCCREARASHQRRRGAERLACFAGKKKGKKIGGGHRPPVPYKAVFLAG